MKKNGVKTDKLLEKFASIFLGNYTPMSISTIREGKFVDVNNAFLQLIGQERDEIIGKTSLETGFISKENRKLMLNELKGRGRVTNLKLHIKTKKGEKRCGLMSANKINLDGKDYLLAVITDITDQKLFEEKLRQNNRLMSAVMRYSGLFIYVKDRTGCYEMINYKWEGIIGLKQQDVLGKTDEELFSGPVGRQFHTYDLEVIETGKAVEKEEVLKIDGVKRFFVSVKFPLYGDDGLVEGICGVIREVTERKRAEVALRESERLYRTFMNASSDLIFLKDELLRNIVVNKSLAAFFDKPEKEIIGRNDFELMPQFAAEQCRQSDLKALEGSSTVIVEETIGDRVYETHKFPVSLGKNKVGVGGFIRDITMRAQADNALRESEEKFRDLTEKSMVGIYLLQDGLLRYANAEFANIFGYEVDEMTDLMGVRDVIFSGDLPMVEENLRKRISGDVKSLRYAFRIVTKNREIKYAEVHSSRTIYKGKPAVIGTILDITDRRRVEEELRRLSIAIEQADEDIVITDPDGIIQYVNPAFEKITGYGREEAIGHTPRILKSGVHDQAFYKDLWNTVKNGNIWRGTITNRRKDGKLIQENATISPLLSSGGSLTGYVALKRDVTDALRLEAQFRQAQKMEAIGTLAGGIAHDFNNILGAMMGYTELARFKTEDSKIYPYLEQVLKACNRSRDLVKQILTFSRQREQEKKFVSITPIVKEALKLLRSSLPSTIEICQIYDMQHDTVLADPTQIHQVLMNLCTNALHAMRDQEGILEVRIKEQHLSSERIRDLGLKDGSFLQLVVSDTGDGIAPDIKDKIFDPFFTTKQSGEGTGLGLSVVYGIVKDIGGSISVESEVGKGSEFKIYLPLIDADEKTVEMHSVSLPHGKGCVIYVDDEEPIALLGGEMLASIGYEVAVYSNSLDALHAFRVNPGRFDLVITDMTMPNMTGVNLSKEIRKIRSDIPIILTTGFSERVNEEELRKIGIQEFLMKPVSLATLAQTIKYVIKQDEIGL